MIKKLIKISTWTVSIFLIFSKIAFALEVDFPAFGPNGGIKPTDSFSPVQWISYIFQFSLAAVGIALIYSFSRAGLEWMFSDVISKKQDAIQRIKDAVLGLVILLGSYIVLYTINPDLVNKIRNPNVQDIIQVVGNPNGNGAVGGCNDYFECGSNETCVDILTGDTLFAPREADVNAPKRGVCKSTDLPPSNPTAYRDDNYLCGKGNTCPDNFRCLNTASGSVIQNPADKNAQDTGKCINDAQPTVGEACSTFGGCFLGTCTPSSSGSGSTCVVNLQQTSTPGGTRASLGSGLTSEQVEILTTNARILSNLEGNSLSLKTEAAWLDMLQVLLYKNLTEDEKDKGRILYIKLKDGNLSTDDLKLGLKEIFYPGK